MIIVYKNVQLPQIQEKPGNTLLKDIFKWIFITIFAIKYCIILHNDAVILFSDFRENIICRCEPRECQLPYCKCCEEPKGNYGLTPQLLVLSFDDTPTKQMYEEFIRPMFIRRKNPDDCYISGTFFVSHEFTDYSVVNRLYKRGYEIGSSSITNHPLQAYWRNASLSVLEAEFGGQRQIISQFANIPESDIIGVRVPQLQLNGLTFKALKEFNFMYDSSWPTPQNRTLSPYTLDYESKQTCHTFFCQEIAVAGFWEMPIVDWLDQQGRNCHNIEACHVSGNEDEIFKWMKKNFHAINRKGVPISFRPSFSWFKKNEANKKALRKFLDYIGTLKNTFIVSNAQILEWSRYPAKQFKSCQRVRRGSCIPISCVYPMGYRYKSMISCNYCPKSFPWIYNAYGA